MLNLSKFASNVLNSIDNAAKESLEEPRQLSAAQIRSHRRSQKTKEVSNDEDNDGQSSKGGDGSQNSDGEYSAEATVISSIDAVGSANANFMQSGMIRNESLKFDSSEIPQGNTGSNSGAAADTLESGQTKRRPVAAEDSRIEGVAREQKGHPKNDASNKNERGDLMRKNKEIERLNEECLELEDQVSALKGEVKEAWGSYKASQERAALREAELQDEIRQVTRAKGTDKQGLLLQMGKVGEEVDSALKKMRVIQAERDSLHAQLLTAMDHTAQWERKEAALEGQLAEARMGSVQGVRGLREEMSEVIERSEKMREEHSSLLRLSQIRQAELEQNNMELSIGITERQREISRLKIQMEQDGREDGEASIREVDGLRQQMASLTAELESERQRLQEQERRTRQVECEGRATSMSWLDERQRLNTAVQALEAQVAVLEDAREKERASQRPRGMYRGKGMDDDSQSSTGSVVIVLTEEEEMRADLTAQVQNLSKQLLKKQGDVLDLQAERAALKSRTQDLLARCSKAEQHIFSLRDADEEDDKGDMEKGDYPYHLYASSTGLQQRRAPVSNRKMMSDLEQMGVRAPATVAKAVNMIDSWTFMTGTFLRRYPLVRLGFILYLLILHLWVFLILSLHAHSLELDATVQQAVKAP